MDSCGRYWTCMHDIVTVALLCILAATSVLQLFVEAHVASPLPLPDDVAETVVMALESSTDESRYTNSYTTAALLIPYLTPMTRQHTTLLVPSDTAFVSYSPATAMGLPQSRVIRSLVRFHMLKANFTFAEMVVLPEGTLLPTLLGDNYRLRVTSALATNFVINNARIVDKDICPPNISTYVTCHGIDRVITGNAARVSNSADRTSTRTSPPPSNAPAGTAPTYNTAPGSTSAPAPAAGPPAAIRVDSAPGPASPAPGPSNTNSTSISGGNYPTTQPSAPAPLDGANTAAPSAHSISDDDYAPAYAPAPALHHVHPTSSSTSLMSADQYTFNILVVLVLSLLQQQLPMI